MTRGVLILFFQLLISTFSISSTTASYSNVNFVSQMLKQKLKPTQAARHVSALYSSVLGTSALVCINRNVLILLT